MLDMQNTIYPTFSAPGKVIRFVITFITNHQTV